MASDQTKTYRLRELAIAVRDGAIPPDPRWDEWYRESLLNPQAIIDLIDGAEKVRSDAWADGYTEGIRYADASRPE